MTQRTLIGWVAAVAVLLALASRRLPWPLDSVLITSPFGERLDPTTGILVTPGPPAPTTAPSAVTARPDRPPAPLTVDDALYRAIAVLGAMCFATLLLTVVGLLIKAAL